MSNTTSSPPGVLVLIADDWSPLARCYGNSVIQTPHIDRFAKDALVFDQAFCTSPSCGPSRANLLTGLYTHQHGQYGLPHRPHAFRTHEELTARTLPAVLNAAGVGTGMLGKAHISPPAVYPFEVFERADPWGVQPMQDSSRDFFEAVEGRPFYLQVASMYPHRVGSGFDPNKGEDALRTGDVIYDPQEVEVPAWLPDNAEVRADLADYYRFVSRFDRFVGHILEELERSGRMDSTMVVVTTDHGMPFPGAKASPYDSGHHCPLIVRAPGFGDQPSGAASQRTDALVNWCDLYPTVCDWMGLDAGAYPDDLPGRSWLPLLQEPQLDGWDRTFYSHCSHGVTEYYPYRVVRERQYKLIHHLASPLQMPLASDLFNSATWQSIRDRQLAASGVRSIKQLRQRREFELYDIKEDPYEINDLLTCPDRQQDVDRLKEALLDFRQATNDPWLQLDRSAGMYG